MESHEAIIIGAGVSGIYLLHSLRKLGVDAVVLEAGDDLGGTWYWNRYPGARFDSESYTYGYSFDPEILEEWSWSEHFAAQPETLRYLNFVVDKLSLRDGMRFGCRVEAAEFDEVQDTWTLTLADGRQVSCGILFTAIGMLSAPTLPRIEGIDSFEGRSFHTYHWPREPVELAGKKVAVIGTGATGVQVIAEIADRVAELTVYQRRPNWCAPLHNAPIDPQAQARIKSSYESIFARCRQTPGGFLHGPVRRRYGETTREERLVFWEELYDSPGFGVWLGNYREILLEEEANAEFSAFIADKIRQRVRDPAVAEKLIPRDHGFGSRRVPLETHYYEAYNRDNVSLVDLNETPIERVTAAGIRTTEGEREFDVIIYATGFDAITGAYDRIDISGVGGQKLRDKWRDGPITYLGLQVAGFPNLIMIAGPQGASVASNFPPSIEFGVCWATTLVRYMREHGYRHVEASGDAEAQWTREIRESYEGAIQATAQSWFTGYNSNVDGHDKLRHMIYLLGAPRYRERLDEVAARGYAGFDLR